LAQRLPDYYMPASGNDFLAVRSIKRQLDGALGAHGAWLLEPYADMPDTDGLTLSPVAEVEAAAAIALQHGFQVNTHAIGTRANRETLDLFQRVWQQASADGRALRWRIEHAQHIHPADIPRFGELGVIAAVQGVHCTSDGPWIPSRLGERRTRDTSYRWRDLLDSGARLNNGTDAPVESLDPFASIHASITRQMSSGEAFYPEQAMTRMEALRSYTLDNAFSAFEEDLKGSISVGKLADLVVLSQDLLSVAASAIPDTKVLYTIIGGEVRYAAP
jgi:predicted amidohydrolase YtcJ